MVQQLYAKKTFFGNPDYLGISDTPVRGAHLLDVVSTLEEVSDDTLVLVGSRAFAHRAFHDGLAGCARPYMKHAPVLSVLRTRAQCRAPTLERAREDAFSGVVSPFLRGYAFPTLSVDKRRRVVPLTELVEGVQLYAYAEGLYGDFGNSLAEVRGYVDSSDTARHGGEFVVRVPSRTPGRSSYRVALHHVPLASSTYPQHVARRFVTDHACAEASFQDVRYQVTPERNFPRETFFCAHAIAAYLHVVDYAKRELEDTTPFVHIPFAIPTQRLVSLDARVRHRLVVQDLDKKDRVSYRVANRAEREVILWQAVHQLGYDSTFVPTKERDGLVKEYSFAA